MLIVFFRAIILYFIIVVSIRLMGKRQIGELQPSELVITILMSNIATLPIEDINIPMILGVVPIFTLVCLDFIVAAITLFQKGEKVFFGYTQNHYFRRSCGSGCNEKAEIYYRRSNGVFEKYAGIRS